MPVKGDTQINNFVGGLITEASPLTFPANASIDGRNFKLKRDGTIERRLGIDYEDGYTLHNTGLTTEQLQSGRQAFFHWPTPNGNTDVDIGIVQVDGLFFFVDLFTDAPSSNLLNQGNSLDIGLLDDSVVDFTIINNQVAVVSQALSNPFLLSYDAATDVVSIETAPLQIRDIYGVNDGLAPGERPTTISPEHEYNLRNQGWSADIVATCGGGPLGCMFATLGVYPSNSDTWSLGKIADVSSADVDKFDPETLEKNSFDIGRAARGHYIIDLYDRGNSRTLESGITLPLSDRELGRVSAVESYAGRLFYSGITSKVVSGDSLSPNLSGAVLYSQVARSNGDLVKCYQEADPTSPTSNDQVDTDGGVIQIAGAVDIVKLMTIKTSLFVFASNGVWQIRGDDGGFKSTDFQVNKISSIGVFSPESIVEANGIIFFWAKSGIYSLTPNAVDSTTFDTANVTISTIQKGYNSLPDLMKKNAKGYYDLKENRIRWLFRSDVPETIVVPDPPVPIVPPTVLGSPSDLVLDRQQPMIARVSDTKAFVLYRSNAANQMYYRIVTTDTDNNVTVGAENTVKAASTIISMAVVGLTDDRILLVYRDVSTGTTTNAMVGTVSGDTTTFGTPVAVGTVHNGDLGRGVYDLRKINDTRVILGSTNPTNLRPNAQIIDVTLGGTITFGAIAIGTTFNTTTTKIAVLSETAGIVATGGAFTNTQATTEHFTISGTTITFNGTTAAFSNVTQYPSGSHQFFLGDIVETSASTAHMAGAATVIDGGTTHGWSSMTLEVDGAGLITSSTILLENTETSSPTTSRSSLLFHSNQIVRLGRTATITPNAADLGIYAGGTTPARTRTQTLDTETTVDHPTSASLTAFQLVQAYTLIPAGTPSIRIVAHTIT